MENYFSHGKLLLTGEYVVLDGAKALAVPTKWGQSLHVRYIEEPVLYWKSYDYQDKVWLECSFSMSDFFELKKQEFPNPLVSRLYSILNQAFQLKTGSINEIGYSITTKLEFPQDWGLGSSSTLINNISNWLKINPYTLLKKTFGGSGYDIASAQMGAPVLFETERENRTVHFSPDFHEDLFFVHLNKKQNSREAIQNYQLLDFSKKKKAVFGISEITEEIVSCKNLSDFEVLIKEHERILSDLLNTKTIKQQLFPNYPNAIKSLGAWGGDFVLATGSAENRMYFEQKGYNTILYYSDMIFQK